MKKPLKIVLGIILLALIGGWIYWQYNKKFIVRNALENAITKKSDSLYYIHYDSSSIDAASGNASFFRITLQSDSLEKQLREYDTASAVSVYNVFVGEVNIKGANVPGLLANEKVEATTIRIVRPIIYVIGSGKKKQQEYSRDDTLAVYEKLLGKFKSINASEIIIENGEVHFTNKIDTPFLSLQGIQVNIKNFRVDSTRDYANIISYFVKDATVGVARAYARGDNDKIITLSDIKYNAAEKSFKLGNFQQRENHTGNVIFDISNSNITGLSTDAFILRQQLRATAFTTDGGLLSFYQKKNKTDKGEKEVVELDNEFFNQAVLDGIALDNITVKIYNTAKPNESPFTLKNVRFRATEIQRVQSGTNVRNVIGTSNWELASDGFSVLTANKVYQLEVGPFHIQTATGKIHVDHFSVKPQMSEAAFMKSLKEQTDLYNVSITNIDLAGVDTRKLVTENTLIAESGTIHPVIKVSCDRTLPAFTGSKIGNYPHQLIQKLKFPIHIKKLFAKNAYISYTERGAQSGQKGTVFFSAANGTIENITNIPAQIAKNNIMLLSANARLMGVAALKTRWELPLNTTNGSFSISGSSGQFNAPVLNPLIEPLGLASIERGKINRLEFSMKGNDAGAKGTATLLYDDLKVEALKKDSGDLKKRKLLSFVANLAVKDANPKNGDTRQGDTDVERDKTRSFFNLVWKGIFKASKRIALGKDDD